MSAYALSVLVPLPAGEKKYDLLAAETADERATSLIALESMEDLLASLDEEQEAALRALLAETATGEEEALEVIVGESNYLVLASVVEHLIDAAESAEPVPAQEDLGESGPVMCDGVSTKETMSHVREGLKTIEAIHKNLARLIESAPSEDSREGLVHTVLLSERVLGLPASEGLEESSLADLRILAAHLAPKALGSPGTVSEQARPAEVLPAEVQAEEALTESVPTTETDSAPVEVESPLQGEETLAETPAPVPGLTDLRKTVGSLITPEFRREFRKTYRG